jgi:hypothetical protein
VWCGLCSRGLIGPFVFDASVAAAACLVVLQDNTVPSISYLFLEEESYRQRDGAQPRYHSEKKIFSMLIFQKDENGVREDGMVSTLGA